MRRHGRPAVAVAYGIAALLLASAAWILLGAIGLFIQRISQ
jgi:hypothetical protein